MKQCDRPKALETCRIRWAVVRSACDGQGAGAIVRGVQVSRSHDGVSAPLLSLLVQRPDGGGEESACCRGILLTGVIDRPDTRSIGIIACVYYDYGQHGRSPETSSVSRWPPPGATLIWRSQELASELSSLGHFGR